MIAKKAATIDQISNGRFILGMGSGWHEPEYKGFGFPFDHRVSRFEEAFTILRELLDTGECDFAGEYYTIEGGLLFPKPVRPGGIPLMVGSSGPRMLAAHAAACADVERLVRGLGEQPDGLAACWARLDAACERSVAIRRPL